MSRRALKNWRVRSRLLLLIIIPTLTAVVLGGTYIVTSVQNALVDQRVETLANLSFDVTSLAAHLEDERDQTMEYIGLPQNAGRGGTLAHITSAGAPQNLALVKQEQALTAPWIRKVETDSAAVGSGYPAQVQQESANISDVLQLLGPLRTAATTTQLPAVVVMADYTNMIDNLLAIDNNIAGDSGDSVLTGDVRALNLISLVDEEASEQRGLLAYAFAVDGTFQPAVLAQVQTAQAEQEANVAEFDRVATPQQVALYSNRVQGSLVDFASNYEQQAITFGETFVPLSTTATTANEWYGAMSTGTIGGIRAVEQDLVAATIARATALHRDAILRASLIGGAVLIVLLLALLLTAIVGRTMVRPLRRLRSGALEVAGVRLPETVRRMSESDGANVPLDIEPIDVDSSDEIGEVARAFDQVHREALRLAANEAALRGNVNAMFVNLSRRSQSLVERQIRLIDDLEQGEQDPDRLSSLFQMDHLATRMRRNSENLLVLAGHDASRRWNQPVALVDVLRAAVSEIEQYERVTLNVQPGIAVRGHAVNDVVHLLAELAENATSFSSAETPVAVAGHLLSSGGVLLDITDQGVGMGAEEMAHANWRLDNPPVVDVAVSRRMGLFVVARLAARHGIRVRLRPAGAGGLTALVWLPDEVISHTGGGSAPSMRRFELPSADGVPGSSLSAPSVAARSVTGTASAMPALPAGMNGDSEDMPSAAEQEINAARAPRFGSSLDEQGRETGLGPRRVPGAGLHPGNVAWGGAATTSPLPAVGTDAAEADLVGSGADGALSAAGSFQGEDGFAGVGDRPGRDFVPGPQSPSSGQPITLGQPTVVGRAPEADFARGSGSGSGSGSGNGHDDSRLSSAGTSGVVVPPAERMTTENRLPIFEAVESDWFRRGRNGVPAAAAPSTSASARQPERTAGAYADSGSSQLGGGYGGTNGGGTDGGWRSGQGDFEAPSAEPEVTWVASAADQGWEAAAAASSPATGGTTGAGLPKRVPQANLVPGTATPEPTTSAPARSASATRDRFASFQRGVREGRAAVAGDDGHSDEDDGSR